MDRSGLPLQLLDCSRSDGGGLVVGAARAGAESWDDPRPALLPREAGGQQAHHLAALVEQCRDEALGVGGAGVEQPIERARENEVGLEQGEHQLPPAGTEELDQHLPGGIAAAGLVGANAEVDLLQAAALMKQVEDPEHPLGRTSLSIPQQVEEEPACGIPFLPRDAKPVAGQAEGAVPEHRADLELQRGLQLLRIERQSRIVPAELIQRAE